MNLSSHLLSKISAFCVLTSTVLFSSVHGAISANDIQDFIPKGYRLEQTISADLNGDRQGDRVLQVTESGDRYGRKRSLIVLLGSKSGWKQLAAAPNLLYTSGTGGVMENIRLEIENQGVLKVRQLAGSRGAVSIVHRFWIDRNSQRLVLIGEDVNPYDRANGNEITDSRNYLTGKRTVEEYRGRKSRNGKDLVKRQEFKVSRELRSIETIDIETVRRSALELPD